MYSIFPLIFFFFPRPNIYIYGSVHLPSPGIADSIEVPRKCVFMVDYSGGFFLYLGDKQSSCSR